MISLEIWLSLCFFFEIFNYYLQITHVKSSSIEQSVSIFGLMGFFIGWISFFDFLGRLRLSSWLETLE